MPRKVVDLGQTLSAQSMPRETVGLGHMIGHSLLYKLHAKCSQIKLKIKQNVLAYDIFNIWTGLAEKGKTPV